MHTEITAPPRPVLPLSAIFGPGLAALAGAYLLTAGLGRSGTYLQAQLGVSRTVLLVVTGAYLLAMAAAAPLGALVLRFPIAIGVPAVAVMLIGLAVMAAPNAIIFAAGRVLVGLGTGVVWAASALTARSTGDHKWRATAMLAGAGLACLLLGPVVADVITAAVSLRLEYFAMIPVLMLALAVTVVTGITAPRKH